MGRLGRTDDAIWEIGFFSACACANCRGESFLGWKVRSWASSTAARAAVGSHARAASVGRNFSDIDILCPKCFESMHVVNAALCALSECWTIISAMRCIHASIMSIISAMRCSGS
jgi:hypothetical protein